MTAATPQAPQAAGAPGKPSQAAVVRCRDVRKSFRSVEVLKGIAFEAYDRRVVSIIGPSGSGKSTFLRCLNHLETIDAGEIWFKDELVGYRRLSAEVLQEASHAQIARMRARIGMVFQNFNLFGHMNALDNVASGPIHVKGMPRRQARDHAAALLRRVGLADKAHSYPRELSGGQQQRVAIARALAMEPELLLMDEPTSSLDPELIGEVSEVIRDLARAGTTMIVVTHEMALARDISDEIVFMADGQVLERGAPQALFSSSQQPWLRKLARRD